MAFDPELAERLLDEAGLPRGADGVRFRVEYTVHQNADLSFAELQAAYWAEIGVQVDVVNTPQAQVSALLTNGPDGTAKYDMATWLGGVRADPMIAIMGWPAGCTDASTSRSSTCPTLWKSAQPTCCSHGSSTSW